MACHFSHEDVGRWEWRYEEPLTEEQEKLEERFNTEMERRPRSVDIGDDFCDDVSWLLEEWRKSTGLLLAAEAEGRLDDYKKLLWRRFDLNCTLEEHEKEAEDEECRGLRKPKGYIRTPWLGLRRRHEMIALIKAGRRFEEWRDGIDVERFKFPPEKNSKN